MRRNIYSDKKYIQREETCTVSRKMYSEKKHVVRRKIFSEKKYVQ